MPGQHSLLSPSASQRWLTCPGSLSLPNAECPGCGGPLHIRGDEGRVTCPSCNAVMSLNVLDKSSEYAAEGSAAHALAERCLVLGAEPSDMLGDTIEGFEVTQEMVSGVELYLDTIQKQLDKLDNAKMIPEVRYEHPAIADFAGTSDCVIYNETTLVIADFKYGAGHPVEVEENTQLLSYALLAARNLPYDQWDCIETVRVIVVQPRAAHADGPVRMHEVSLQDLYDFENQVIERTQSTELKAGSHCRWCPCKIHCPELERATLEAARNEFAPQGMTPEKAAEIIENSQAVKHYMDAVYRWALGRAEHGEKIPGYKLVQALKNRAWTCSEDEVVEHIQSLRKSTPKSKMFEQKLLSPAKMEKALGKRGPDIIADITERALKGPTLVPECDSRPEIEGITAEQEFSDVNHEKLRNSFNWRDLHGSICQPPTCYSSGSDSVFPSSVRATPNG